MQTGQFEPTETVLLRHLLSRADLFVNVGANFGYYICMARQLGIRSVAVEPVPINVETLRRNIAVNSWDDGFTIHPVACGETAGDCEIFGEGSGASLIPGWARNPSALCHTVPVVRLDDLLKDEKISGKSVFLVDVEGFELEVLRGAQKILTSPDRPIWMLESGLTDHRPEGNLNTKFLDVVTLVQEHGYIVLNAQDPSVEVTLGLIEDSIAQGVDQLGTHNFVLIPKEYDRSLLTGALLDKSV
ncbi:FkbM family methyltransferase [Roseovarius aestuarii]|nr:FkbM family methyltransferase [Roseovarius aestuarii]